MAINGIDPSAKTPSRIRRDLARLSKGSATATLNVRQPVAIDTQGRLNLNTSATGGLSGADVALKVNVDNATLAIVTNTVQVKDGGIGATQLGILTTKGDIIAFGTTAARLPVGSDGQVLTADSGQTTGVKWADSSSGTSSPLTTKGDIWAYSTTDARLPVGTDGQVLSADSSQTTGLKWIDAASGGGSDPTAAIDKSAWSGTWSGGIAGGSLSDAWDGSTSASLVLSSPLGNHFVIDMGAVYLTSRVKITSQATTVIPTSYTIDVSLDGTTYTTISSSVTASVTTDYTFSSNAYAQYIRITPNSNTDNGNWFVNELDFFGAPATGSVYSVSVAEGTLFTVVGNPITTFGTITLTLNNASANSVFAGPGSGSAATPSFRSMVAADLPGGAWIGATSGESVLSSTFALSGSDGTYQDTGLNVSLPAAGTYLVMADCRGALIATTAGAVLVGRFFDTTNTAAITDSETNICTMPVANAPTGGTAAMSKIITAAGAVTIRLDVFRSGGGTYSVSQINSNANGKTRMRYIRLA